LVRCLLTTIADIAGGGKKILMRAANITTGIAVALWLGMFLMGRSLAYGVYSHGADVFPSAGQIDYYVLFPVAVVVLLTLLAWISNIFRRWPARRDGP
jgi:hypothetical protein